MTFYKGKQKDIGDNLKDLESILQGKANNLRVVEDGMHKRSSYAYPYADIFKSFDKKLCKIRLHRHQLLHNTEPNSLSTNSIYHRHYEHQASSGAIDQ